MPSLASALTRVSLLLPLLAGAVSAQSPLSHLDDAAPVPAGMMRLRIANVWTRFDQRFASDGGTTPLGAPLSVDSLGVAQFPLLTPIEASLRTLASDPLLHLSLGRLHVGSNARIVTTPIAIEYGVTRRLSVGLLIPIVQTRRVAQATVAGDSTHANVGYVPAAARATAGPQNALVAAAFQKAADSLGILLTRCPTNPTASGCAAVNANTADATAARARALAFVGAVTTLGVSSATAIIAPRASSDLADTLDARRIQLNQRLQQYLGASAGAATRIFTAGTDFSYLDLQGRAAVPAFLASPYGGGLDSIHTTERIGFGDIAVGAQFLVFDRFQHDAAPPPRVQSRLIVGGALRFATSRPDSAQSVVDIATGDGAGVEVHSAWDVILGHFGSTVAARYTKSFARTVQAALVGDPDAPFPYPLFGTRTRTAGDVLGLDVTPRLLLTESLALDGHYGLERIGATTYDLPSVVNDPCANCQSAILASVAGTGSATTTQRFGFGLRYSTVDMFARGTARYPIEISFARLVTLAGDPGVAKQARDQIQVRLFYQVRRAH